MRRSSSRPDVLWPDLVRDFGKLGVESAEVMARRCLVLARCDKQAGREFALMVGEKIAAVAELQYGLLTGQLGPAPGRAARATLGHVRRKVRANRARLRR